MKKLESVWDLTARPLPVGLALVEAVRTSFYRCELLPPEVFAAVKDYERVRNGCQCECHKADDHCDACCQGDVLCASCVSYGDWE